MNNDVPDAPRGFSRRTAVKTAAGAATVGAVALASARTPAEAAVAARGQAAGDAAPAALPIPAQGASSEPIVVHVRNLRDGELGIFVGSREITVRDRALAARIAAAAR